VAVTVTGDTTAGSAVITNIADTTGITAQFGVNGAGTVPFANVVSVTTNSVTLNMPLTATATGVSLEFSQIQYNLPTDWLNQLPQTEWDRTNRWPLIGPQSPQDWQSFKSGIVYAGPRQRFRIQGNALNISPPPPNGLLFSFEYVSSGWVESSTGTVQTKYLADTDTAVFPDSLLITGLKTQWKAAKGLDASFDLAEFTGLLEKMKGQDQSAPKLSLSPYGGSVLLSIANISDSGYGE